MEDLEDLWGIYGGLGMPNTKLTLIVCKILTM